jgi:hypothetical protein
MKNLAAELDDPTSPRRVVCLPQSNSSWFTRAKAALPYPHSNQSLASLRL